MFDLIKKAGGDVYRAVEAHSPEICLGLGIAATVAGTVFACKGTIKAKEVIDDAKHDLETINKTEEIGHTYDDDNNELEYTHEDSIKDKAIVTAKAGVLLAKAYGPAIILTVGGIALLIGGHHILKKRNFALVAAYESLSEAYKKYQDKVKDILGETTARDLKYGIEEKEVDVDTGKKNKDGSPKLKKEKRLIVNGNPVDGFSPYCRIYDAGCPNWEKDPAFNLSFLKFKQNYWNEILRSRANHTVFLNEVYSDLGFPVTEAGQVVGWTLKDGEAKDGYIDFGIFNLAYQPNVDFVNGYEPVCLLDFNVDGVVLKCLGDGE